MNDYIKFSIEKFKQDGLSKVIYDAGKKLLSIIVKWLTPAFILFVFPNIVSKENLFSKIIFYQYTISLYDIIIFAFAIIIITIIFTRLYFRKKYLALERDNFTDELTGLKNHKALAEYLKSRIPELKYSSKTLSILLIDVDDFKKFNTKEGYNTSDRVLAKLGQLLGNDKRATDETFRFFFRGDEFVIVANETNLNEAYQAAERKRKLIETTKFIVDEKSFSLTVSCGVTEFKIDDTYETLLERANSALLLAKEAETKNRSLTVI